MGWSHWKKKRFGKKYFGKTAATLYNQLNWNWKAKRDFKINILVRLLYSQNLVPNCNLIPGKVKMVEIKRKAEIIILN